MADHSLPEEVVGQVVEQRLGTSLDTEVCAYVAGLLDDGIELEELRCSMKLSRVLQLAGCASKAKGIVASSCFLCSLQGGAGRLFSHI